METPYRPTPRARCLLAAIVACTPLACSPDGDGTDGVDEGRTAAVETSAADRAGSSGEAGDTAGMTTDPEGPGRRSEARPSGQTREIPAFRDHDRDGDGRLDGREFGAWVDQSGVYASWVYEAGADLDVDRVAERMLVLWDRDQDSLLAEGEWEAGVRAWFRSGDYGAFPDWDADGDGAVRGPDVARSLESRGLFDAIDGDDDGFVDDAELAGWMFDVVDADGDGRLDTAEWDAAVKARWVG